ncbi:hypothetical protein [Actinomadura sp. CNU-125]|uniref:hypothetical protein n=1 Tax=Actinomadura sp. CNU-125 TaxID=1904961 RepID=UPI001177FF89|nr:hypothetical protein [Actinomadura sp. CNU-125]
MDQSREMSPEQQQTILAEVGRSALELAPQEWDEIRYTVAATARFSKFDLAALLQNGELITLKPPMAMGTMMLELRAGMYRAGQGTWFTANYTIVRPSRYNVDFDYDNEPDFSPGAFDFEPVPETYVEDLEFFPRNAENIPDWLRQKINEAQES